MDRQTEKLTGGVQGRGEKGSKVAGALSGGL